MSSPTHPLTKFEEPTRLALRDTIGSAITKMAEGNPGAATILVSLLTGDPHRDFDRLLFLDDLNLRGSALWLARRPGCDL
jgi:hypothetical protein